MLPVTPGQAGSAPAESSIEFRFLAKSALFYCVFLRRLSRNKARPIEIDYISWAGFIAVILPQAPLLEPIRAGDAARRFRDHASVQIPALIGAPTDKAGAPLHAGVEEIGRAHV